MRTQTIIETALSGYELLNDPLLNKGTAFTDAERDMFDLHGLLPPYVTTLDLQVGRRLAALRNLGTGELRKLSFQVALATAQQAENEGLALPDAEGDLATAIKSKMWEPLYAAYRRLPPAQTA